MNMSIDYSGKNPLATNVEYLVSFQRRIGGSEGGNLSVEDVEIRDPQSRTGDHDVASPEAKVKDGHSSSFFVLDGCEVVKRYELARELAIPAR
jgi:hypothetical protein